MRIKLVVAVSFFGTASVAADLNLCHPDEAIVFSCTIDRVPKVVSLCASPGLTSRGGSLYYRYGALPDIEMEYPKKPLGAAQEFRYAHYSRFQTERYEVTFSVRNYSYAVFDYYEENEKTKRHRGIRVVNTNTQRETNFVCKGNVVSNIHQLDGKVPCDTESALAQCN